MVHLLNYDPCPYFTRAFCQYPCYSEVKRSVRFNVKACFGSCNNNGNDNVNEKRVFLKEKKNGNSTNVEHRSQGGSHNNPFCFPDYQFSQKLVVAVDVDEGLYLCILMLILDSYMMMMSFF